MTGRILRPHSHRMDAPALHRQIDQLLARIAPTPICDGCIAGRLRLSRPQLVNPVTRRLSSRAGFERRRDICASCYDERLVIRRLHPLP